MSTASTPAPPFRTPRYPRPDTAEDERTLRKQRLAVALRVFARYGFDEGCAGHLTARDPVWTDHFWVNPVGIDFAQVRVRDLVLVSDAGEVKEGEARVNKAAFAIHSAIHRARPDVHGACHAHSVAGRAFSTLGRRLDPLTQDACAFYEDHALFDDYGGVVEGDEGDRIAAALGGHKAAILRNHGLLTVGGTIDEAAWWFVSLDRCCRIQLDAMAAGEPVSIPHEMAIATRAQTGDAKWGRFNFAPMYSRVVRESSDVFD